MMIAAPWRRRCRRHDLQPRTHLSHRHTAATNGWGRRTGAQAGSYFNGEVGIRRADTRHVGREGFGDALGQVAFLGVSQGAIMALDAVASGRWTIGALASCAGLLPLPLRIEGDEFWMVSAIFQREMKGESGQC
jgi:hypothetical protein